MDELRKELEVRLKALPLHCAKEESHRRTPRYTLGVHREDLIEAHENARLRRSYLNELSSSGTRQIRKMSTNGCHSESANTASAISFR